MKHFTLNRIVASQRALWVSLGLALFASASAGSAEVEVLINGTDLAGWRAPTGEWLAVESVALDPADRKKLICKPGARAGVLVNGAKGRTVNLISEREYGDVEAHIEFFIAERSNSGIYFMGRYEIQVYDSFGVAKDKYPGIECGGIYPRWADGREFEGHSPRVNASRPPGEWQSLDVLFRAPRFDAQGQKLAAARFVKVALNSQLIHENVEVTGPTRAATYEHDEKPTGPFMVQGDHGPVAYRNLRIKRIELK
jgi:hypothetical protein